MKLRDITAGRIEQHPLLTRFLLLFALLSLNGAGFVRWYRNRTPNVPLDAAIEALRKHDSDAFSEAVDVDRLIASYYDQHLQQGKPVPEAIRNLYIKAIGRRLRHWIDSGVAEASSPHFDALVNFLREAADSHRWKIHDVNSNDGSGTITLHNIANDTVDMKLKIVKETGRWRVAELLNVEDVVRQVRMAEWHRLGPRLRMVNDAMTLVPLSSSDSGVENNPITTYQGKVHVSKGTVEWALCDLYSAGGTFTRTIAVVNAPLTAGREKTFSFQWKDCGAIADCLPVVRWAQISANGTTLSLRPRPLD